MLIHAMNTPIPDLNLLAAFTAVWRTRSVSRAAEALGIAQPTLSNALRRLRAAVGDALFVRGPGGVVPTPFAEELAPAVAEGLGAIERALARRGAFDPATQQRAFTIIMTDIAAAVILPRLVDACRIEAPLVSFRTVQLPMRESAAALETGTVDLAIGYIPGLTSGVYQQLLFETDYVAIESARRAQRRRGMTRQDFLSARHAVADAQGTGHSVVEQTLARQRPVPRIGARVPHFLSLPLIVAASDMVATVPRPLGYIMRGAAAIRIHAHPLPLPRLKIKQFWHERFNADPANRWLRGVLRAAFVGVDWGE